VAEITIGVPVFNGMPLFRESLECLRAQAFRDFEVWIFDNASSDDTPQFAAQFVAADSRFSGHGGTIRPSVADGRGATRAAPASPPRLFGNLLPLPYQAVRAVLVGKQRAIDRRQQKRAVETDGHVALAVLAGFLPAGADFAAVVGHDAVVGTVGLRVEDEAKLSAQSLDEPFDLPVFASGEFADDHFQLPYL
jgi:glycosyltransferase involved in cell wall biosynthesis